MPDIGDVTWEERPGFPPVVAIIVEDLAGCQGANPRAVGAPHAVAPGGVVPDAIWRVRHHEVRGDAVEAPRHHLGIGRIAADEPVPAEEPDVTEHADRVLRPARSSGHLFSHEIFSAGIALDCVRLRKTSKHV